MCNSELGLPFIKWPICLATHVCLSSFGIITSGYSAYITGVLMDHTHSSQILAWACNINLSLTDRSRYQLNLTAITWYTTHAAIPYSNPNNIGYREAAQFKGRKSKLSLENKTLIYKCILKPIWTYGIQLWGCAKPSNTKIIQRLQSNVLRTITNVPWYVSNFTLHNDLQIPFITEETKRYWTIYYNRLIGHENSHVTC
jgi:hypothetical protein